MGPMVEIEREKVPRRRASRTAPANSRPPSPRAGLYPLFSLCYGGGASRRCLFHPTAKRILATYARLPSKYLPFPCPDERWLAVTRFRARARLVQPRIVVASLLLVSEGKTSGIQTVPPSTSTFSTISPLEARASSLRVLDVRSEEARLMDQFILSINDFGSRLRSSQRGINFPFS